jgi:hypothetical protein
MAQRCRAAYAPRLLLGGLISVSIFFTPQILHYGHIFLVVGGVSPFDAIPKEDIKRIRQGSRHKLLLLPKTTRHKHFQ